MDLDRRSFLKGLVAGAALVVLPIKSIAAPRLRLTCIEATVCAIYAVNFIVNNCSDSVKREFVYSKTWKEVSQAFKSYAADDSINSALRSIPIKLPLPVIDTNMAETWDRYFVAILDATQEERNNYSIAL